MSVENSHVHRPGALKQTNKPHKHGRHRSKGSISIAAKGKVSVKTISKKVRRKLNKEQRRNQSQQIRQNKRYEVLSKKRSVGGLGSAPFLVCILPLNKLIDTNGVLSFLTQCDEEIVTKKSQTGVTHITIPRFKQQFSFITPTLDNEFAILDTLKVCDTVVFVVSAAAGYDFGDEVIDDWGNYQLLTSFAQGLPTPTVVVTELEGIPQKKRSDRKQEIQNMVGKWLPDVKISTLDKNVDALNLLRKIGSQKRKRVIYRDRRPHLYAEEVEYVPDSKG